MKKKLLRFLCTALMTVVCMSVNAQASGSCGANATWEYDNGTLTISGTGAMADYTDALTDNPWNNYRNSITKVVIGDDITHIGNWAFMGCSDLYEVTIGDHVASIGAEAFANCLNEDFKYLAIPASVENIGAFALSNIKYLEYIACYASTAPTLGAEALTILNNLVAIYVPTAKVANYQAATGWSDLSAKITYPHGNCGDGEPATDAVTWAFDMASGTMTLTGTGAVKTFSDQNPMAYPWNSEDATVWNPSGMDGNAWGSMGITSLVIGEGITNIPDYAFGMQIHLTSVTLPSTLTSIGASSLEECAFTSITLPEGLETIGDYAFLASKFSSITLPSTLTTIGGSAFNDCKSLTSITIPANVTSIGESAFQNCIALETVTMLRATPPTLGDLAFYDYSDPAIIIPALTAINVPAANVEDYKAAAGWSDYAALIVAGGAPAATTTTFTYTASEKLAVFDDESNFTGATGVKSHEFAAGTGTVVYDGTVTAIEDYTFRYDSDAKEKLTGITIPESVTNTGEYTFWMCKNLATVTFDGTPTLSTIGKSAFKECEALTAIAIPASVEEIGISAFSNCTELASVTFSGTSSLTTINQSAFSGCTSLTSITLPESLTTLGSIQDLGGGDVYYNGSVFWNSGLTTLNIPKNVTNIYGAGYFVGCNMTALTVDAENAKYADLGSNAIFEKTANKLVVGCNASSVPAGVTTIGYESFWAISDPFTLTLPASVTTIEARAFHLADGLTAINIPSGVTEIGEGTFAGCGITTLVLPDATTTIGREAFNGCPELTTLTLGSELTTIGEGAFSGCAKLTSLIIPAKVTTLENAFSSGNLATITVAAGNTKYDSRGDCNAIIDSEANKILLGCKNTTFPADVTSIGDGAFTGCKGLTSLVIPNTVTSIGSSAFSYCSNLSEISIPNTVTSIESSTFQSCKSLTTLVIHNDMTSIGSSAFSGCSGLNTVTLGSGLTSIGQRAFSGCTEVTDVYCYADPEELTWSSAGLYFGYDFKDGKATLCHVADASAWPCTSSSDKFYKVNVTFVGDLAPAVAGNAVDGVYWATYYNSAANMKADANTIVYKAAVNGSSLTLTEIADKVINAGEAVILKSTGASIAMTTSAAVSANSYSGNDLEGVDVATAVDANYNYYVLSNVGSTLGFYKYNGTTLGANKAFIKTNAKTNATSAPEFIVFNDGNTTSIRETLSVPNAKQNAYFDLQGRRVVQPTKGLYIVNGKKVVIK